MLKQCPQCPYQANTEQELFNHLVDYHGMTQMTTPPALRYYWQSRIPGQQTGFYERPNPLTGKATDHQQSALKNMVVRQFNPNPVHAIISPSVIPPWEKINDNYFVLNQIIINEAEIKKSIVGKLTPGYGVVRLISHVIEHKQLLKFFNQDIITNDERVLLEEYKQYNPYRKTPDYHFWQQEFMRKSIELINTMAPLVNSEFFPE